MLQKGEEHVLMSASPSPARTSTDLRRAPTRSEKDAGQQKARRRHRGEKAEGEQGDATPDLLLKHPDATFATYV
jgi:hypothetical protein